MLWLGLMFVVLMIPAWMYLVSWQKQVHRRRIEALGKQSCPNCGEVYGSTLAEQSAEETEATRREEERRNPELRMHFASAWVVQCRRCSTEALFYYFDYRLTVE